MISPVDMCYTLELIPRVSKNEAFFLPWGVAYACVAKCTATWLVVVQGYCGRSGLLGKALKLQVSWLGPWGSVLEDMLPHVLLQPPPSQRTSHLRQTQLPKDSVCPWGRRSPLLISTEIRVYREPPSPFWGSVFSFKYLFVWRKGNDPKI